MTETTVDRRCVIVTGGSKGIGLAAARRFAAQGDQVAIVFGSDEAAAEDAVARIVADGGGAQAFRADIGSPDAVREVIATIAARFGRIDVLVNNAAHLVQGSFNDITDGLFDALYHTNVLGPITAIKACLAHLPAGGRIVNVISCLGVSPNETVILYASTKAALRSITQSLSHPLGRRGITINCVAPGLTRTAMVSNVPEAAWEQTALETAMARNGEAEDIAPAILFLASEEARWITGRTIVADGGRINY